MSLLLAGECFAGMRDPGACSGSCVCHFMYEEDA